MPRRCSLTSLSDALRVFAFPPGKTQSADHIKPLHWYVASRLVIEGGFRPDEITPRPPFAWTKSSNKLRYDKALGGWGERTVIGGLKTKNVDVVVCKEGIGPVLAVSLKGTHNAFRNLTNRMEEAAGDCTNVHMAYPSLAYAFWHVLRANDARDASPQAHFALGHDRRYKANDIAISEDGRVTDYVERYARALARLSGREDLRDNPSRYEVCGLTLVDVSKALDPSPNTYGSELITSLNHADVFARLYDLYDRRFVYQAPALASKTARLQWNRDSPFLRNHCDTSGRFADYRARAAD